MAFAGGPRPRLHRRVCIIQILVRKYRRRNTLWGRHFYCRNSWPILIWVSKQHVSMELHDLEIAEPSLVLRLQHCVSVRLIISQPV